MMVNGNIQNGAGVLYPILSKTNGESNRVMVAIDYEPFSEPIIVNHKKNIMIYKTLNPKPYTINKPPLLGVGGGFINPAVSAWAPTGRQRQENVGFHVGTLAAEAVGVAAYAEEWLMNG